MRQVVSLMAAALTMTPAILHGQAPTSPQMNVMAQSSEYRYQMDFHVNDATLAKFLPSGWVPNVATTGPAKDCNVRLIFSDISNLAGPDGKLLGSGSNLVVLLEAPVKSADGSQTGRMVLAGIGQKDSDPGYGNLEQATQAKSTRSTTDADGTTVVEENWTVAGSDGSKAEVHVKYTRKPANRAVAVTNYYDPTDPAKTVAVRTEQQTDITRNLATNPPDRVTQFSYKVSGGKFGKLFDGSEKILSWDSQPVYGRAIGTLTK